MAEYPKPTAPSTTTEALPAPIQELVHQVEAGQIEGDLAIERFVHLAAGLSQSPRWRAIEAFVDVLDCVSLETFPDENTTTENWLEAKIDRESRIRRELEADAIWNWLDQRVSENTKADAGQPVAEPVADPTGQPDLETILAPPAPLPPAPPPPPSNDQQCFFPLTDFLLAYRTEAEPMIDGLLRCGEVLNLIGGPKSRKSWLVGSLCLSVAAGLPFLDRVTKQGRVLLLDFELPRGTASKRLRLIADALGVPTQLLDQVVIGALRGRTLNLDELEDYASGGEFDLIVVDPLFHLYGSEYDENSNSDCALLYDRLVGLAERTKAAIVLVHHLSKGSQADKATSDLGAGAGSQARAADVHLAVRDHAEDNAVVLSAICRSFPPIPDFCLRYSYPLWKTAPELDPANLARKGRRTKAEAEPTPAKAKPAQMTPAEFVECFVTAAPASRDIVLLKATAAGLTERLATRLLKAVDAGELAYRWPQGKHQELYSTQPPPDKK